jgi:MFS family permease
MSDKVFRKGFNALLATMFLGACNDNVLKQFLGLQVVAGVWQDRLATGGQGLITAVFSVPFLLFSGWAGQYADRVSKSKLGQWVKILEIFIALVSIVALLTKSLELATLALLMLAVQSTLFGPVKYGILPEMFPVSALGRANGALNLLTNIAVILGVYLGGLFSEGYPAARLLPGMVMLGIALMGYLASLSLEPLPAHDPTAVFTPNPFNPYIYCLRYMSKHNQLLLIAIGWEFFYFIGSLVLQAILDFKEPLGLSDKTTSLLNVPLALGIVAGSGLAGLVCKNRIRTGLIPVGALGISVFFGLLGLLPLSLALVVIGLFGLGTFGGLYVVPLQALLQARSPENLRGRILGTCSFLGFSFIALSGLWYLAGRSVLGLDVRAMLLICGILTLVVGMWILQFIVRGGSKQNEE